MWLTEDIAIRDLRSVCRMQRIAVASTPNIEINIKMLVFGNAFSGRVIERRIIPYPPSFKSVPARTIDPAMGASTCALGSQRCKQYMGIFTRNARLHAAQNRPE